ncbi:MAG: flagellar basal body rod protein FlgC [Fimbriimonadaceae bacterium]
MSLNAALRVSASGLTAERFRMDVISGNIANANTSSVNGKDPYRRRTVLLTGDANGVTVEGVVTDGSQLPTKVDFADPNHDAMGRVRVSNVQPVKEMVDMLSASRAYEANVAAFNSAKEMIKDALTIGKV